MEFLQPSSWAEALQMKSAHPEAMPIAGGTDVMVEINLDRHRPAAIIDLTRIAELKEWGNEGTLLRNGAGVTYARIIQELGDRLPGLAMASRTVGSPQIRNRGTVGGNLGSASPAGDAHPPLLASGAVVELASTGGSRRLPAREFFVGPKRNAMKKDELIAAFLVEPARGPQQFSKVGTRNAMVIAVCSLALAVDPERRHVGTGIGSAAPTPVIAEEERFIEGVLDEAGCRSHRS
jgi:CO/xanthine dehydrogenase FAD-binding subunit